MSLVSDRGVLLFFLVAVPFVKDRLVFRKVRVVFVFFTNFEGESLVQKCFFGITFTLQ
jgi:hypothetical protein